jgi:hypothetical protein
MSAPAPARRTDVLVELLRARAEARALLWQAGELELHDAVDELEAQAALDGLDPDLAQAILAEAFAAVREDPDLVPDPIEAPTRADVASTTLMAAEFLVREGDAARLRAWLARHSAAERRAINRHLEGRRK